MIATIIPYVFLAASTGLFVASGFFRNPERRVVVLGLSAVCSLTAVGLFVAASV